MSDFARVHLADHTQGHLLVVLARDVPCIGATILGVDGYELVSLGISPLGSSMLVRIFRSTRFDPVMSGPISPPSP